MESIGRTLPRSRTSSSLDAMEKEIRNQVEDLPLLARDLRKSGLPPNSDPSLMIFTGAGDSFASALLAHSLSQGRAIAQDPYELYLNPELTKGKTVFIISVSGKTRTNVKLAERVRGLARKRVAITENPGSPLAKACDSVIQLRYRTSGILTSGTIGFTSSLLVVASLITGLPKILDLKAAERSAAEWAQKVGRADNSGFFFIGSGVGYGLAAYGAFKIHEVLGAKAEYQYPEQFGHAQLFSVRRTIDRIFCIALNSDRNTRGLFRSLSDESFRAYLLESDNQHPVSGALEIAFHLQHLALSLARRMGLRGCAFLDDQSRLDLSSRLIY